MDELRPCSPSKADAFFDCHERAIENNDDQDDQDGEEEKFFDPVDEQRESVSVDNHRETAQSLPLPDDDSTCDSSACFFVDEELMKRNEAEMGQSTLEEKKEEAVALKASGNEHFRSADFDRAAELYTQALKTCPVTMFADLRAVLYSNRAAVFGKLNMPDDAIADCTKSLELDPTFIKALHRRAQLFETKDELDKALADYQSILAKDPSNVTVRNAVNRLTPLVQERHEKLKAEMIDKLKDLGNMILRPFGLSTDNFQLQPNASGGYSVQMNK